MVARELHGWDVSPAEAQAIQRKLAGQVSRQTALGHVALIAGADVHFLGKDVARGAVVLLSYPALALVESQVVEQAVTFPYIPGLLSFRESPVIMRAFHRLSARPDLLLVDGQGIAHPRRMGIASHLGLLLDIPTIGCAKSRLWGVHGPLGEEVGAWVDLVDGNEVIGCVLRTKEATNPLYISIGHKVDLSTARYWVMACCRGYRLPEPTRLAHQAAGGQLRPVLARLGEEAEQGRLL